ncbi:MAG: heparin lyase I family protein [Candidatus Puniceispirillales bacterium]
MVAKYLIVCFSLILFSQTINVANACSFNCSATYSDGNEFGLKASSNSGFKKHRFEHMPKKKHSFKYIKDKTKARAGKAYQRFELRDGDCFFKNGGSWNDCKMNRERFEFYSSPGQKPNGKQCYGYSIKLAENFKPVSPTNTDLGQVHQRGGPKGTAGGLKSFPPLIQIGAKYNGMYNSLYFGWHKLTGDTNNVIDTRKDLDLAKISEMKGVWTDISFCLDYKNKRMDAWINGKKKVEILESPINFIPKETYFKYGIYRSFVSRYKNIHGKMPTQIVFYDEVRRGRSIEEVDRNINPKLKPVD